VANTRQAKKRTIQSKKHREHNFSLRSMYRTAIKKVLQAIEDGNKDAALEAFKSAVPTIDKMVTKGIMHKNKAARHKSRLNAAIKTLTK